MIGLPSNPDGISQTTRFDFPNQKPRRGAVKDTEGYNTDSSDEGESVHTRNRKPEASNADDEDDMFGATSAGGAGHTSGMPDLDAKDNDTRVKDSGLKLSGSAAKGGKEFLDLGDIEGQEFTSSEAYSSANREERRAAEERKKVRDDEEDYVEGEEHANDDDAVVPQERKDAEGMGFAISRFNMQDEMQEGRFSADGTYIANSKDPDSVYDNWLSSLSAKDLEAAAKAKERQEAEFSARTNQLEKEALSRVDCLKGLIEGNGGLVKAGESVQAALARLGKARKIQQEEHKEQLKREKRLQKQAGTSLSNSRPKKDFDAPDDVSLSASVTSQRDVEHRDIDLDPFTPPQPSAASLVSSTAKGKGKETSSSDYSNDPVKKSIDLLTSLASTLLGTYGETDIYEETHEGIIRQLVAEGEVPRNWKPSNDASEIGGSNGTSTNVTIEEQPQKPRRGIISRPVISGPKS